MTTLLTQMLGGLGIFLFGMNFVSTGLQRLTVRRMELIMGQLTRNRLLAVLVGVVITVLLQSSSAATVLLVGFVSASLITLERALAVILGSAIGTTLTVQIIAFKITDYALLLVAPGTLLYIFGRKRWHRHLGQAILGFGFVFYGMSLLSSALEPMRNYPGFVDWLVGIAGIPALVILVSAAFTAVIQSSAATIVLAMSLAGQGLIGLPESLAVMLGANIGTTATALISSVAASREAKRVAVGHFFIKALGVGLFILFLGPFSDLLVETSETVARQIANGHTIFNIVNMALFLPFTPQIAQALQKLLPEKEDDLRVKYIDKEVLAVPELALDLTRQELVRMAKIIEEEMLPNLIARIKDGKEEELDHMEKLEDTLDYLYDSITKYLSQLVQGDLTEEQAEEEVRMLYVCNDLEHLGDVLTTTVRLGVKMDIDGVSFSKEGWSDLEEMLEQVEKILHISFRAYAENDANLAKDVVRGRPDILQLEKDLRYSHFYRLQQENKQSLESSSYHVDLANMLLRLHSHGVNIAQAVLGII